jgi:hypothetical protein
MLLALIVLTAQSVAPIARYPLVNDLADATGHHAPAHAANAPFVPGKGLFCNGQYIQATPDGCDVQTPALSDLDFSAFTISVHFYVPRGVSRGGPIFTGGPGYRWVSYELEDGGAVALDVNSRQAARCSVKYRQGVWHEATITYDGRIVTLYLDGVPGCQVESALQTGNEKTILLTNFGSATTFYGVARELTVWNGIVVPAKRSPEADDLTLPIDLHLSPADQLLARCPTPEQLASIDHDFRLTFDTDPTANEPLACTAAAGSRDLSPLKKHVYNSLLLIRDVRFDEPLPWTKEPLYTWLAGAIAGARFRGDITLSNCCLFDHIVNIAANGLAANDTDRWLDPSTGGGLVGFVLLLVHEARHGDRRHPHTCAGATKDETLDELGAWGVQYYLTRWFAEHTDQAFFSAGTFSPSARLLKQAELLRMGSFCRQS